MWVSVCYCYSPKKCNLPRGISCNCVLVFIHLCHTCTSCFLFRFVSDFDLMIQKKKEVHTNLQSLWLLKGTYSKMFCFFSVISSYVASCKQGQISRVDFLGMENRERKKSPWLAESFSVNYFVKHQLQNRIWVWPMLITDF